MMKRISLVVALLCVCGAAAHAQAADVYITPTGSSSGICTSGVHDPAWFNNSANWGTGGGQIGPSTVVHLCGTFTASANTTVLTAHGSGTSGHPITILFESGAHLTSPVWPLTGAINISTRSYIVVDGGTNGVIDATDSGTNLTYHPSSSRGIYAGDSNASPCTPGCRVTNLTIANLYVHVAGSDCSVGQENNNAVSFWPAGAGFRVDHNIFHDIGWAVNGWGDNIEIDHNDIYHVDHGTANGASGNTTGETFHDNHIHDLANWDTSGNCYHHDGIHIWNSDPGTNSNVLVYRNIFDGDCGTNLTSPGVYTENRVANIKIFNNVFSCSTHPTAFMIWMGNYFDQNPLIVNNTIFGLIRLETNTGATVENNILNGANTFLSFVGGTTLATVDFNEYEHKTSGGGNFSWNLNSLQTDDFNIWKLSSPTKDTHGNYTSTSFLNPNGTLTAGSPAINLGTNLTSLGIAALNSDILGNFRPASGAWTSGAYNSGVIPPPTRPNPPTGLTVVVH